MRTKQGRPVNPQLEWLNSQIDRLQAGKSLRPLLDYVLEDEPREYLAMLQMAAQLNSLRRGATCPRPAFIAGLRERVMAGCEEDRGR